MEYAGNTTNSRAEELKELDLVWLSLVILVLFSIYAILLCLASRYRHGCVIHIHPQAILISESTHEMSSFGKISPPPPYEHPPSYAVAVSLEN